MMLVVLLRRHISHANYYQRIDAKHDLVTCIACIKSYDISNHKISLFQLFPSFPLTMPRLYNYVSLFIKKNSLAVKEVQGDYLCT